MEVHTMLRGRRSATALVDDARGRGSDIAETVGSAAGEMGSRAAETVTDFAERAADFAREAQRAATPVIRSAMATAAERAREAQHAATPVVRSAAATAAEALSDAAEHAAEVLADTAERLAQQGTDQADELQLAARTKLADASEQLARRIRPRRRRRLRAALIITGVIGGITAVLVSPIGERVRRLLGMGETPETPPEPGIILPGDQTANDRAPSGEDTPETPAPAGETATNGDRVLTGGRPRSSKKG
jgi:hypothetical protein